MKSLQSLLLKNAEWALEAKKRDPDFFERLLHQQSPKFLWIGCSDSRVPANQIVGLLPGELFVHRNVANLVVHTDLNCLTVLQFAVEVLKVEHVIVCGHYGCGGIKAAYQKTKLGLAENWLRHVQDVARRHATLLDSVPDENEKLDLLSELNVLEQVLNVCQTTIVQNAWERKQQLAVHGWIYGIHDGRIKDLGMDIENFDDLNAVSDVQQKLFHTSA